MNEACIFFVVGYCIVKKQNYVYSLKCIFKMVKIFREIVYIYVCILGLDD